ncbi:MAG: L-seryl-tRNA(Sec) selenium transferase, partial [Actinomycetota bacterium]
SARAEAIVRDASMGRVISCDSLPGAGSSPGATIPSRGIGMDGDHAAILRWRAVPIVARVRDDLTVIDLRTVDPADDGDITDALHSLRAGD